jgi:hypothetical protein
MKIKILALFMTGLIGSGILSAREEDENLARYFENLDHKLNP